MCTEKFPLASMGGWAEGLACADPGARTPIGASGNFGISTHVFLLIKNENILKNLLLHILIQFHILVKITVIIQARNSYLCTFDICIDWAVQKSQTKLFVLLVDFFLAHPLFYIIFQSQFSNFSGSLIYIPY